jgi:hypothetical protein
VDRTSQPDLDRIQQLALQLAATVPGPGGQLATEIADSLAGLREQVDALALRVDGLWRLISAIVESAGLGTLAAGAASSADAIAAPPPEFVQALDTAKAAGRRGVRLTIGGQEWVAALSQQPPAADGASWSAIERLTRESAEPDDEPSG